MLSSLFALFGAMPAIALGGVVVFVLMRYFAGGKVGPSPVRVNPGEFRKLLDAAVAGNSQLVVDALRNAFELDLKQGDIFATLSEWALFEAEQRVKDPSRPAPVIEILAWLTKRSQEEVLAIIKEDFAPKPAVPAVVLKAVAIAALLLLTGTACAAYPSHINADVRGPQRFYPTETIPITTEPLMWQQGRLVAYQQQPIGYRVGASVGDGPTEWAEPVYYQNVTSCHTATNQVGFMQRGPVRRWIANGGHPVARGAGRIISAPFRFLFRRWR